MPKRFGDWKIIRPLGEGGQGHVYVAQHYSEGRTGVLKVLKNKKRRSRFEREIAVSRDLADLGLPVAEVLDHATAGDEKLWYVMPQYPSTLDELIRRGSLERTAFCPLSCVSFLSELWAAIDAVHEAGVVHRDLKPDNIFLGSESEVVLGDLGLAQDLLPDRRDTATGEQIGSRHYIAPEALDGRASAVSIALDAYSFGKIAYVLATSKILPGLSMPKGDLALPEELRGLNTIIFGLVAHDPALRLQAWARVGEQLRGFGTSDIGPAPGEVSLSVQQVVRESAPARQAQLVHDHRRARWKIDRVNRHVLEKDPRCLEMRELGWDVRVDGISWSGGNFPRSFLGKGPFQPDRYSYVGYSISGPPLGKSRLEVAFIPFSASEALIEIRRLDALIRPDGTPVLLGQRLLSKWGIRDDYMEVGLDESMSAAVGAFWSEMPELLSQALANH